MLQNREGQKVPQVTFKMRAGEQWKQITTDEIFKGKKVILFALPGAYTPTCSSTHLPRYNELAPALKKQGIDSIVCLSVNDPFVMQSWQQDQKAEHITFIPDGNGEFTEQMGMLVDKNNLGFGKRSWRYSMYVEDGVIKKMFIEPEVEGDPFQVSDADTMYSYLLPQAAQPKLVALFAKEGCPFCAKAKALLKDHELDYTEILVGPHGVSTSTLRAVSGKSTVPQVYIDGKYIGGSKELETYFKTQS